MLRDIDSPSNAPLTRSIDELLWSLRRDGFVVSTAQAIDVLRAVALVGLQDRAILRAAVGAVVVERRADLEPFADSFDRFFTEGRAHVGDLFGRLRDRGFDLTEIGALRELLDAVASRSGVSADAAALAAVLGTDGDLERLLRAAGVARTLAPMVSPLQIGFFTQQLHNRLALPRAGSVLKRIRDALREALGVERGDALADAVLLELERVKRRVRDHVASELSRRLGEDRPKKPGLEDKSFFALSDREIAEVRRAVRSLGERLRGAERVRLRRARTGRIDVRRTLRKSFATGGVPFAPARLRRRRDKPKLVLLCDVSESVRSASLFLLEFVSAAQELFAGTRSFVFVSEVAEVTDIFASTRIDSALARVLGGDVVSLAHNSNYGRALLAFEAHVVRAIDRRTTVVILGDGRTNYLPAGADVVERLRERARAVLWLTPEGPASWGSGDSAMLRLGAASSRVLVARTAKELEIAAREITQRRK